jgi:hypothetical protein
MMTTRRRPRLRHVLTGLLAVAVAAAATVNTSTPASAQSIFGPDTCLYGYVWREATPADHVCVTSARRDTVAYENQLSPLLKNPSGPFGPESCKDGWVWREATASDRACVTSQSWTMVHNENATAGDRRAIDLYSYSSAVNKSEQGTFDWQFTLELSYTGAYTFRGYLENHRTLPVDYVVACSMSTLDGRLITIAAKGTAKKDSKGTWTMNGTSGELANHWHAIPHGTAHICHAETGVSIDTVVKRIQTIEKVVSGIAKVISWF